MSQSISLEYGLNHSIKGFKSSFYPSEALTLNTGFRQYFNLTYGYKKSEFALNYDHTSFERTLNYNIHQYCIYDKKNLRGTEEDTLYGVYMSNFYSNNIAFKYSYRIKIVGKLYFIPGLAIGLSLIKYPKIEPYYAVRNPQSPFRDEYPFGRTNPQKYTQNFFLSTDVKLQYQIHRNIAANLNFSYSYIFNSAVDIFDNKVFYFDKHLNYFSLGAGLVFNIDLKKKPISSPTQTP